VAVRLQYHRTCDRCSEPFDQKAVSSPEELPTRKPLDMRLMSDGKIVFEWNDLCTSCESAVSNLLDRLRLAPKKTKAEFLTENPGSPTENPSF
jgi:hypothetical protein